MARIKVIDGESAIALCPDGVSHFAISTALVRFRGDPMPIAKMDLAACPLPCVVRFFKGDDDSMTQIGPDIQIGQESAEEGKGSEDPRAGDRADRFDVRRREARAQRAKADADAIVSRDRLIHDLVKVNSDAAVARERALMEENAALRKQVEERGHANFWDVMCSDNGERAIGNLAAVAKMVGNGLGEGLGMAIKSLNAKGK